LIKTESQEAAADAVNQIYDEALQSKNSSQKILGIDEALQSKKSEKQIEDPDVKTEQELASFDST